MMVNLTQLKQGINRLRTKGGANPESLYDLLNGYVTTSGTVVSRGGTSVLTVLPANTKGMCVYESKLHVFHASSNAGTNSNVTVTILPHPENLAFQLKEIHFAQPYLKYIYVVAEYTNNDVFHFWIKNAKTWTANTVYKEGELVSPTTLNGYSYKAKRINTASPVWEAKILRAINDVIEPTTHSGYKHTVTAVTGTNPASGLTEPTFAVTDGGITIEYSYGTIVEQRLIEPVGEGSGGGASMQDDTSERYDDAFNSLNQLTP